MSGAPMEASFPSGCSITPPQWHCDPGSATKIFHQHERRPKLALSHHQKLWYSVYNLRTEPLLEDSSFSVDHLGDVIWIWTHLQITHCASGCQWYFDGPGKAKTYSFVRWHQAWLPYGSFCSVTPFDKPVINRFPPNRPLMSLCLSSQRDAADLVRPWRGITIKWRS